jgi:small-conductance mechanosensitive channel
MGPVARTMLWYGSGGSSAIDARLAASAHRSRNDDGLAVLMRHRQRTIEAVNRAREHDWKVAIPATAAALAALGVGSSLGSVHTSNLHKEVIGWASAGALVFFGVIAVRRASAALGNLVTRQPMGSAAPVVRLIATGFGYVVVTLAIFNVLGVSITHLLIGAGLAGVVLGIAAQQSLSNVFAALVLILARPFVVGDRIRVRSGPLGGTFDATVIGLSLTYVAVETDDGPLKVPNSIMLAAAVGRPPRRTSSDPPPVRPLEP